MQFPCGTAGVHRLGRALGICPKRLIAAAPRSSGGYQMKFESTDWQEARIIPVGGISGQEEQENRATSALLAVMRAVPEFATAILRPFGAPAGRLSAFIEVPFELGESTVRPDGVLTVSRGSREWSALVEVKTGSAQLERLQVENYLDVARSFGGDAVITLSNQFAPAPGTHPVEVDKRKIRKVQLWHLSWAEVLAKAIEQQVHRGVSDPDQSWLLGEFVRYLEHPRSGALGFADMGTAWTNIRDAAITGTLRPSDNGLDEVCSRWDQLLRFTALHLDRELGGGATMVISRKEQADPASRIANHVQRLSSGAVMQGALRVPKSVSVLDVAVDLKAGEVSVSTELGAPQEGRPLTRVNWLIRQLVDAPDGLRIEVFSNAARSSMSELLRTARSNPTVLVADPKTDIRRFVLTSTFKAGKKRGRGKDCFIDSVINAVDTHYESVHQRLRPWAPRAPQMPKTEQGDETAPVPPHQDVGP